MYYLSCVKTVLQIDDPYINRLSDDDHYYRLDEEDELIMLRLVTLFEPRVWLRCLSQKFWSVKCLFKAMKCVAIRAIISSRSATSSRCLHWVRASWSEENRRKSRKLWLSSHSGCWKITWSLSPSSWKFWTSEKGTGKRAAVRVAFCKQFTV